MSPPIQISSIPTLSDLYKTSQFDTAPAPAPGAPALPPPSSTLNSKISLIRTSITNLATTSIVNAANTSLLGGGGVDGAIHAAAGPSLLTECSSLNGCPTGSAKLTSAHALPSSYIIHAVGPVYSRAKREREGLQAELLRSCYRTSLDLAAGKGEEGSVAFSCLSTGVYGYPSGEAAEVAAREVRRWLEERGGVGKGGLERVVFCCFEGKDERAYREWLPKIFPPTEEELAARRSDEAADEDPVNVEEAGGRENARPDESQANNLKMDSEDIDKNWEAVEKPSAASSEKTTDISEEGEKIEAANLAEEEGVEVEKPVEKGVSEDWKLENKLVKDW